MSIPALSDLNKTIGYTTIKQDSLLSGPAAASGRLQEPRIPPNKALSVAGIEGLTLHWPTAVFRNPFRMD